LKNFCPKSLCYTGLQKLKKSFQKTHEISGLVQSARKTALSKNLQVAKRLKYSVSSSRLLFVFFAFGGKRTFN